MAPAAYGADAPPRYGQPAQTPYIEEANVSAPYVAQAAAPYAAAQAPVRYGAPVLPPAGYARPSAGGAAWGPESCDVAGTAAATKTVYMGQDAGGLPAYKGHLDFRSGDPVLNTYPSPPQLPAYAVSAHPPNMEYTRSSHVALCL